MKNHKLIKLGILTSSALVLGLGQPVLQTVLPGFDGGVVKAEEDDTRRLLKVSAYGYEGDKRVELIPESVEYVTPNSPYTVAHPKVDGWKPTVTVLGTFDGTISRVESGSKLTYDDLYYEGGAGGGGINYVYERVSESEGETISKPEETSKVAEDNQEERSIAIQYVEINSDGSTHSIAPEGNFPIDAFLTSSDSYTVSHPAIDGYTPSGVTLFTDGVETTLEDGKELNYNDIGAQRAMYNGVLTYKYTAVSNTAPETPVQPVDSGQPNPEENQQPKKFRVHYWDDSFGADALPTYTPIQAPKEIYLQPGQSVTEVAPDIPGYTLATNIEGNLPSYLLDYDNKYGDTRIIDDDGAVRIGFHYTKIDAEKPNEIQPEKPVESVKQPEPFDYIEYGIEDGGHQVELFRERRYIQPGEVLTITPTPKEGYTLKDARPITVRYTEAKQTRNQYAHFSSDYTASSYAVTYLKNGANIPKQPELKYEYYDEEKAKELLESYEYKRKLVERALEIDPDDYTPESYWKTYTGTSEGVTFSNGNFRTEIILLDTRHSLEQPLSEMRAFAPDHYDYLINYNKATASIIKQSLDGLVPIKKTEEEKPTTPVQPQVETRRIHVVYQDITKLYTFGDGKDIELSPGQSYTVVMPDIEGYKADSFDFADSYFWTHAGLKNREEHYTRGLTSLTLNYDEIAPVTEDGRVHNPILYMQYRPVNTETEKPTTPVKPIQPEIPAEKPTTPVQPTGRTILVDSYGVDGDKVTSFVNNDEAYITPESPYIVNQPEIAGWERGDIILVNPDGSEKKVTNGSLITYESLYHEGHSIYDGGLKYTYKRSTKQKSQEETSQPTTPVKPIQPEIPTEKPVTPVKPVETVVKPTDTGKVDGKPASQVDSKVEGKSVHQAGSAHVSQSVDSKKSTEQEKKQTLAVTSDKKVAEAKAKATDKKSDAKSLPNTGETQSHLGIFGFLLALLGIAGWSYQGRHDRKR